MALGIGYGLPFVAQHGTNPYKTQWSAALEGAKGAGASVEDENAGTGSCLVSRGQDVYTDGLPSTPSLLIVPQFYKAGNLYQDVPPFVAEDTTMRFTVSRNTTATRVNSSGLIESVASGVPRIDWLGQSCPALLVEASGQNLVFQSQNITSGTVTSGSQWFDSASLQGTSTSVENNVSGIIAPDGTQSASLVSMTRLNVTGSTGSLTYVSQIQNLAVSGTYTSTIYIRAKDSNQVGKQINVWQWNGSATINMILVTLTNDWQRVETTKVSTLASGNRELLAFGFRQNQGNDLSAEFYVWGAQGELGSVATTYIPTTTAAVSRAADVISASGALVSGLIGQTEGTIYLDLTVLGKGITSSTRWLQIFGASNNIGLAINSSNLFRSIVNTQSDTLLTAPLISSGVKVAWAYDGTGTTCFINGTQYTLTNGGNQTMSSLTSLTISGSDNPQLANARIRAVALYTTRLSNAQLAELTRL